MPRPGACWRHSCAQYIGHNDPDEDGNDGQDDDDPADGDGNDGKDDDASEKSLKLQSVVRILS